MLFRFFVCYIVLFIRVFLFNNEVNWSFPFTAHPWRVRPPCVCRPLKLRFNSAAHFSEALTTAERAQSRWEVLRWRRRWKTEVIIWGQAALAESVWTAARCRRAISIPHSLTRQIHTSHPGCLSRANPSMVVGGCVSGVCAAHVRIRRLMCMKACACIF